MPGQESFLELDRNGIHVEVLKVYDKQFAREAFDQMSASALEFLGRGLNSGVDVSLPFDQSEFAESLWEELEESAREDWNTFSYFVVMEDSVPTYVSPDWPSAEAYARQTAHSALESQ